MIPIELFWDDEASVWVAVGEQIGLALESESYDALIQRVKIAAPEMAELNNVLCLGLIFETKDRQIEFA